ncbi:MAG: RNA 3'-phosphate cyclase [Dechloromonas sp.]|nr:RNA 3'-phosphate cyclase [Dechloromonas sp.]
MIAVDASHGSGGGFPLRSALVLSLLSGRAVRLTRIRARRTSPGLKLQHLRTIDLLARACDAHVTGAVLGSQSLIFEPRREAHWDSVIDIDTPGSLTLLLQTLLVPLSFSGQVCRPRLAGVTHAARSPAFENLAWHWLPLLGRAGYQAEVSLQSAGFAPKGGGIVHATIQPVACITPLQLTRRGALQCVSGRSVVAGLSPSVSERQIRQLHSRLHALDAPLRLEPAVVRAAVPGSYIVLQAEFEHSQQCLFTLGELGKPPETVANEAADALLASLDSGAAVDAHSASQLLLPLCFAAGESRVSSSRISEHMLLAAEQIEQFLDTTIDIAGRPGEPGQLLIRGRGAPHSEMPAYPVGTTSPLPLRLPGDWRRHDLRI